MTADTDICNLALSEIGAKSYISSLSESSAEAAACNLFYDRTRKEILRAAHWGFARKQLTLTELGNLVDATSPAPWSYKYAYPSDCLAVRYILASNITVDADIVLTGDLVYPGYFGPSRANRFLVAYDSDERVILSNVQAADAVYTANVENPDIWDPLFERAVVTALASRLILKLTGNIQLRSSYEQIAFAAVQQARAADGNEAVPTTDHTPDWIKARTGSLALYGPGGYWDGLGSWYTPWSSLSWGE